MHLRLWPCSRFKPWLRNQPELPHAPAAVAAQPFQTMAAKPHVPPELPHAPAAVAAQPFQTMAAKPHIPYRRPVGLHRIEDMAGAFSRLMDWQMVRTLSCNTGIMRTLKGSHPIMANLLDREPEGLIKTLCKTGCVNCFKDEGFSKFTYSGNNADAWTDARADLRSHFLMSHQDQRLMAATDDFAYKIFEKWHEDYPYWVSPGEKRNHSFVVAETYSNSDPVLDNVIVLKGAVDCTEEVSQDRTDYRIKVVTYIEYKMVEVNKEKVGLLETHFAEATQESVFISVRDQRAIEIDVPKLEGFSLSSRD